MRNLINLITEALEDDPKIASIKQIIKDNLDSGYSGVEDVEIDMAAYSIMQSMTCEQVLAALKGIETYNPYEGCCPQSIKNTASLLCQELGIADAQMD